MLPPKIAFVDVETTGTSLTRDRIIEIGVVRVEDGKVVDRFQSLLNPDTHVPTEIEALTGIASNDLVNAPHFTSIRKDLYSILDGCVFSAHNVRFDYGFVRSEFAREDVTYRAKNLCTVKLSRTLFPRHKHHNLDSLIERFDFSCPSRHRALDDAWVCWQFYEKLGSLFEVNKLEQAIARVMKRPSLPINLSEETLESLPEGPGVYLFYGKDGMPLYVGKSVNIRERVLSHFATDHSSSTEMKIAQQIHSIETIPTNGELGALFKEAQLVKSLQPLYNRQLRRARKMILGKMAPSKYQAPSSYFSVTLEEVDQIDPAELDQIIGVFKSQQQARQFLWQQVKDHKLCPKLLGLEKGKGACFGYRLGKCSGGCLGKENPALYNGRLTIALAKGKLRRWPFTGPIAIEERLDDDHVEEHIIDQWCYLGSRTSETQELSQEIKFDLDTYKILNRFLKAEKNRALKLTTLNSQSYSGN